MITEIKNIENMSRLEIHQGLAQHFRVAVADIATAFSPYQTDILRSVLGTVVSGRTTEKQFLAIGAGITGLAAVYTGPALLSLLFGSVATLGLYGAQRLSRWRMERSFIHSLSVLENGRPRLP